MIMRSLNDDDFDRSSIDPLPPAPVTEGVQCGGFPNWRFVRLNSPEYGQTEQPHLHIAAPHTRQAAAVSEPELNQTIYFG